MENQREKRRRIKSEAKEKMRQSNTSPYLSTVIYGAIIIGAVIVSILCVIVPVIIGLGISGFREESLNPFLLMGINGLVYIMQIVLSLLGAFLSIGFRRYTLKVYRGHESRYTDVFSGFTKTGVKAFLSEFLSGIMVGAVTCAAVLVILSVSFIVFALVDDIFVAVVSGIVLTILALIPIYMLYYSFIFSIYIIHDDDNSGIAEAVFKSYRMMKGNKWGLFKVDLSFMGWFILCTFTLGFAGIYVFPYLYTVRGGYYEEIKREYESAAK